jgi:TATA-box binding protein (TBP) (component of TFIID and TFIIIB)
LKELVHKLSNVVYNPKKFSALNWQHRKISGKLQLFLNGTVILNGAKSYTSARKSMRQYGRCLQKLGYKITVSNIRLVNMSAVHKLANRPDLKMFPNYELELSNNVKFVKYGMTFLIHHPGTVIITGIKTMSWKLIETLYLLEDVQNLIFI